MIETEVDIKIPFHDVDSMEVAWHGHYVKYFEIARCALLDQIKYNYVEMRDSGYAWPVIDLHVRYAHPCFFGQDIQVQAKLVEWENRLKINYRIIDAASGKNLSKGHTIQVAVKMPQGELQFVSPLVLFEKLGIDPP